VNSLKYVFIFLKAVDFIILWSSRGHECYPIIRMPSGYWLAFRGRRPFLCTPSLELLL